MKKNSVAEGGLLRAQLMAASLRAAVRALWRAPRFTLGVVLTFALGIGANGVMFGILDRLLLSPPAHVQDADQVRRVLVESRSSLTGTRGLMHFLTYPDYQAISESPAFSQTAIFSEAELTLGRGLTARQVPARLVTHDFFPVLRVQPALGRFFNSENDQQGASGVAVISHALWNRAFGGDRDILGKTIDFGYGSYNVVGVAPAGFTGVDLAGVDLWLPLHQAQAAMTGPAESGTSWLGPGWHRWQVVARLAPGVSVSNAEAQATTAYRRGTSATINASNENAGGRVIAASLIAARGPTASDESVVVKWLGGVSLVVLLIACANIANLMLLRGLRRKREVGIRLALGSSRGRIIGQVIAESTILALAGGVAALMVTQFGGSLVHDILLPEVAWSGSLLGARTLALVTGLALLTGVATGLVPAVQLVRREVNASIGTSARGATGRTSRIQPALTVAQAALSVVLLIGAGLFVRSLQQVQALDLGIDPRGVLYVTPQFERGLAPDLDHSSVTAFYQAALERLSQLPEVNAVAATDAPPFQRLISEPIHVPGLDSVPTLAGGGPYSHSVTAGFFTALGLQMQRGGAWPDVGSDNGADDVAVINATMARTLWPGTEPLGECFVLGGPGGPCTTVVGVVEDARRFEIAGEAPAMSIYSPLTHDQLGAARSLLLHVSGDRGQVSAAIRRELAHLSPELRFAEIRPLQEIIEPQLRSWKLGASVLTACGILALIVAALGLYSVLSFAVVQRTREIGIRSALGASSSRIARMVVSDALKPAAAGIAAGVGLVLLTAERLEPLLFGVGPRDPATIGTVALVLTGVAVAASWLPARRAATVEPTAALREE